MIQLRGKAKDPEDVPRAESDALLECTSMSSDIITRFAKIRGTNMRIRNIFSRIWPSKEILLPRCKLFKFQGYTSSLMHALSTHNSTSDHAFTSSGVPDFIRL